MGDKIFLLNSGRAILSCYSNNETLILASLKNKHMEDLRKINYAMYAESGTLLTRCLSHEQAGETMHKLNITTSNHCEMEKKDYQLDITFLDTLPNDDLMFVSTIYHVSNTKLFVIDEMTYFEKIPLLSVQGFIIDCSEVPIEHRDFLNALFDIS